MVCLRRLPRLIVFDCDHTLWPFGIDNFYFKPPYRRCNGRVFDSEDKPMECFPEVTQVFHQLNGKGIVLGVASRTQYPIGAHSLIDLFEWNRYIKYRQIFTGSKQKHFNNLKINSGFSYKEMVFFDDEQRNIDDIQPLGVLSVLVDRDIGVTLDVVDRTLQEFVSENTN